MKRTDENSIFKKWELSIIDGEKVNGNSPIYLEFSKDNRVSGFIGCNRLTGSFTIENKTQIRFNQLATTMMACPEMDMAIERQVLELLNTVDNFTIDGGKLMLNIGRRAPLALFYEMSENEIVNKYWKLIKLDGKNVQMAANQEREQYFILRSDGTISGFAGCNHFNGQYELAKGNRISIHDNLAVTMKACPDVNVDETVFLKLFGVTDHYTIKGDTLCLKNEKKAPIAVFEAIYF